MRHDPDGDLRRSCRAAGWLLYRVGEHQDVSRHELAGLQLEALLTTITHQLAASGEKPGADLDAA